MLLCMFFQVFQVIFGYADNVEHIEQALGYDASHSLKLKDFVVDGLYSILDVGSFLFGE